ncbi:DUF4349 domain-containing protein [Chloroflexota bacterium]
MKKLIIGLSIILLLLVPVACAKAPESGIVPMPAPAPRPSPAPMPAEREATYKVGGITSVAEERMIVRNGEISLVVEDVISARDRIAQIAVGFGGYVVSSRITGEEQDRRGTISIRVPDEEFESVLTELRNMSVRVKSESTSSQDVTEEYVDLEARLKNALATEQQYLTLLDKAIDVEDILRIYDSLSRVRSEIEQIKGRMQYLERTSSMSLITVRLEPEASAKPLARAGWNALEVLKSAVRGLVTAGQVIASIAIWLILFIPIWGTILGIVLWRLRKRKRA